MSVFVYPNIIINVLKAAATKIPTYQPKCVHIYRFVYTQEITLWLEILYIIHIDDMGDSGEWMLFYRAHNISLHPNKPLVFSSISNTTFLCKNGLFMQYRYLFFVVCL